MSVFKTLDRIGERILLYFQILVLCFAFIYVICVILCSIREGERLHEEYVKSEAERISKDIHKICIAGKLFVRTRVTHSFAPDSWDVKQIFDTDKNGNLIAISCSGE